MSSPMQTPTWSAREEATQLIERDRRQSLSCPAPAVHGAFLARGSDLTKLDHEQSKFRHAWNARPQRSRRIDSGTGRDERAVPTPGHHFASHVPVRPGRLGLVGMRQPFLFVGIVDRLIDERIEWNHDGWLVELGVRASRPFAYPGRLRSNEPQGRGKCFAVGRQLEQVDRQQSRRQVAGTPGGTCDLPR